MVCRRRLLLCDSSLVHRLGSQYEAEGKDHRCLWSQSWNIVSLEILHSLNINLTRYPSAGICGIIRTKALAGLNASEYICMFFEYSFHDVIADRNLDDTVPMLIWSATESCVTIMGSTIPVLRPLYIHIKYGPDGTSGSSGDTSYRLPLYGSGRDRSRFSKSGLEPTVEERGATHHPAMNNNPANASNENILRGAAGIERTEEVSVSYEQFGKNG